jgi:hypothetical protein
VISVACSFKPGVGIEYSWGGSKLTFRRENDCSTTHLRANVEKSFRVLDLARVRKYARRARTYRGAYKRISALGVPHDGDGSEGGGEGDMGREAGSPDAASFTLVEKMVKESKIHRCILNQEKRFLSDSVADVR